MTSPTYDGKALFESGPATCEVGGTALRHVEHEPMRGDGVHVIGQGRSGRAIVQHGTLLGDTIDELQAQVAAIEAYVDGMSHALVDEHGRSWPDVVMLAFEPAAPRRMGVRWRIAYRITYQQVRL